VVGTPKPGGFDALVEGADSSTLLKMRAIAPFTHLLDMLL
jgi:hypothetical protein